MYPMRPLLLAEHGVKSVVHVPGSTQICTVQHGGIQQLLLCSSAWYCLKPAGDAC
jgi:hypothetical protein